MPPGIQNGHQKIIITLEWTGGAGAGEHIEFEEQVGEIREGKK